MANNDTFPKKTAIVKDGRKKIHTAINAETELVEEFDAISDELLVRKWRRGHKIGTMENSSDWEYEIGEAPPLKNSALQENNLLESSDNPIFVRQDASEFFVWRVRNLPYPLSTYNLTIQHDERKIVVRTSNKKYFKKFNIPDLDRKNILLDESCLSWTHENNTLIIKYKKPKAVLLEELLAKKERAQMKVQKEGEVECPTQ